MKKNESEEFIRFWELWLPHKRKTDGRGLARETFNKRVKDGADPEDIVLGAAWYLRTMKDDERKFIPLSSTWMNRGGYEDDCEYERKRLAAVSAPRPVEDAPVMSRQTPTGNTLFLRRHAEQSKVKAS